MSHNEPEITTCPLCGDRLAGENTLPHHLPECSKRRTYP